MKNYSYADIAEKGIAVCVSCGGSNINCNWKIKVETLPLDWCFDCSTNEGINVCMPDDEEFYLKAKETIDKLWGDL